MDRPKNSIIDILYSIFIVAVLFIHQDPFGLPIFNFMNNQLFSIIVITAVGGFIFLSGYKLTNSKLNLPLKLFLYDRFIRIFPLYWLSLVLYPLIIQPGLGMKHFLLHVFGFQIIFYDIFGPPFLTIYFIGLLILYYLIFAFTKKYLNKLMLFLTANIIIIVIALNLHLLAPFNVKLFEYRFFLYYAFFIAGIIFHKYKDRIKKIRLFNSAVSIIPFLSITVYIQFKEIIGLDELFRSFSISYFVLVPSILLLFVYILSLPLKKRYSFFSTVSYTAFIVFLFHRQVWWFFNLCWSYLIKSELMLFVNHDVIPFMNWFFVNIFGTAILFISAYWAQYFFDKNVRK